MKGHHARLGPETHQRRKHGNQKNPLVPLCGSLVQGPSRRKIQRVTVPIQKEDRKQAPICAAHGIKQILQRRHNRLPCPIVEHQRHGDQGCQLIEQIHGHKIAGKIQRHQHTIQYQVEAVISFFLPLMLHIDKGKQSGQDPYKAHHRHKQPSQNINMKIHRNPLKEGKQYQLPVPRPGRCQGQGHRNPKHSAHIQAQPGPLSPAARGSIFFPKRKKQQKGAEKHWQHYGNQQKCIHPKLPPSQTSQIPSGSAVQWGRSSAPVSDSAE